MSPILHKFIKFEIHVTHFKFDFRLIWFACLSHFVLVICISIVEHKPEPVIEAKAVCVTELPGSRQSRRLQLPDLPVGPPPPIPAASNLIKFTIKI